MDKLTLVGTAKRWPRPLDRGGLLIDVKFLILFYNYLGTLMTGSLKEGGSLMGVNRYSSFKSSPSVRHSPRTKQTSSRVDIAVDGKTFKL